MPATRLRGGIFWLGADEGHGGDDAFRADLGTVHDHGVHADERVAADAAAVEDRTVADMAVLLDDRVGVGKAVHDAGVLEVGAGAQLQAAEIAAQRGGGADIAARVHDHVADQDRGGVDEGGGVDDGDDAVDGVDVGHRLSGAGSRPG